MKLLYEVIMGRGQRIRDCICGADKQYRQKKDKNKEDQAAKQPIK